MDALTRAVRQSIMRMPVSLRELARRSGTSHVHLSRIVSGERRATAASARAIAEALDAIAAEAARAAARVRRPLTAHEEGS